MKNKFKFLATMLIGILLSTNVWGGEITYTFTSTTWEDDTNSWTSTKDGTQTGDDRGIAIQKAESGAGAQTGTISNITKVKINCSKSSKGVGSIVVKVGETTIITQSSFNTTDTPYESDDLNNVSGVVSFTVTCTTSTLYVKSISITTADAPATPHTITFDANGQGTLICSACINGTLTETDANAGIVLPSCEGSAGHGFLGWSTSSSATEPGSGLTAGETYYPTSDHTLYAVYGVTHRVTWYINGSPNPIDVADGATLTIPTSVATAAEDFDCGGKTFVGWTNSSISSATDTKPGVLFKSATGTVTADANYYAVYATVGGVANEYTRVTGPSELEDGMSVVLVSNKFSTALTHTETPGLSYTSAPTESNSKITATDAMKWTLEKSSTKWLIKYGSNTIGAASLPSSGSSKAISFTSNYNTWTIGQSIYTANTLYVVQSDNVGLEAPSNSGNWVLYGAYVKSSEYCALKVYKETASYSQYTTSCATYNVTWKVNNATYEAGGSTTAPGGGKVSALPTAPMPVGGCVGSTFMGWTASTTTNFGNTPPDDLFKDVEHAPAVTGDVTYHAVFADENE